MLSESGKLNVRVELREPIQTLAKIEGLVFLAPELISVRLNQATVSMPDLDAGWRFYCALGFIPIVDSRPRYVRFQCPDGDSTLSLQQGAGGPGGTTLYFECEDLDGTVSQLKAAGIVVPSGPVDRPWLWREAELSDPGGNRIVLYYAGENRLAPPWRVTPTSDS